MIIFNDDFVEIQKKLGYIDNKVEVSDDKISCIDDVIKNKSVCCLIAKYIVDFYLQMKSIKSDEIPTLNVLDSTTFSNYWCYIHQEASPYVNKINSVALKIKESGLHVLKQESVLPLKGMFFRSTLKILKDSFLVAKLGIVLATGYSICLCILIFEILFDKLKRFFNLNQNRFFNTLKQFFHQF